MVVRYLLERRERPRPIREPPPGFNSLEEWKEFKRRYKETHGYPEEDT